MKRLKFRVVMSGIAAALLLCACGSAGNGPQQNAAGRNENVSPQSAAPAAAPESSQPAKSAMREFIDPATGKSREPTAEDIKALEKANQGATRNAAIDSRLKEREILLPNGTVAIQERSMAELKGCIQPDGHVVVDHDCKSNPSVKPAKP